MEAGAFSVGNPANLTSLDVACGMPLGWNSSPPPRPHRSSLDEFASLLFSSSFGRGPCYMPFSGGSESSTWLAVATRYARSHGHDDPIPITLHYPGLASPEQLGLQERVIAQLGLADWERVEPEEDLDLIGPVAGAALRQTGPLWPPHAYVMAPLARGGTRWRVPTSDRARRLLHLVALGAARRRCRAQSAADGPRCRVAQHDPDACGLACAGCASAGHAATDAVAATGGRKTCAGAPQNQAGSGPRAMQPRDDGSEHASLLHRRSRHVSCARRGAWHDHRTSLSADPAWSSRSPALVVGADSPTCAESCEQLAGDLLPADLLVERPAPDAIGVFFGARSREFATSWTGGGLDESIVDVDTLRQNWLSDRPDPRTACLLQYAWLTEQLAGASCPFTTTDELILTHQHN